MAKRTTSALTGTVEPPEAKAKTGTIKITASISAAGFHLDFEGNSTSLGLPPEGHEGGADEDAG